MSPILSCPGHGLLNKMTVQSGSAFFRIGFLPVFKVRQNSQIFMNVTTFQISFPRLLEATWRSKSVVVMETSFTYTLPFISLQTNGSFTLPRSMVGPMLGFSVEWAGTDHGRLHNDGLLLRKGFAQSRNVFSLLLFSCIWHTRVDGSHQDPTFTL